MSPEKQKHHNPDIEATTDFGVYGTFWNPDHIDQSEEAESLRSTLRMGGFAVSSALPLDEAHVMVTERVGNKGAGSLPDETILETRKTQPTWEQAALAGSGYSREAGRWPANGKEWRKAQRAFRKEDHHGTLRATLRSLENGVYEIDRESGRSSWRGDNGSLDHYQRKTRKSIKRTEKVYRKLRDQLEHESQTEHSDEHKLQKPSRNKWRGKHQKQQEHNKKLVKTTEAAASRTANKVNRAPTAIARPRRENKTIILKARDEAPRRVRTELGRRYQEQQARNRRGVV